MIYNVGIQDTLPPGSPRVPIYMTTAIDAPSTIDPISAKIDALEKATPKKNFFEEASKLRHLTFEKARENIIIKMPSMTLNPKEDYLKVRCYLGPSVVPEHSSFYPGMFKFLTRVRHYVLFLDLLCRGSVCDVSYHVKHIIP